MDDFEKFYNKALRFLSFRPRSEKEVRENLRRFKSRKKVEEVENVEITINKVIEKLKEQRFLNDEEFVKWWIEQRTQFKPRSTRLIKLELKQKGIPQELIESAVLNHESGANEVEMAKKIVASKIHKYKGLSHFEIMRKLGSQLTRRGFDYETIKQAIDEILKSGV